MPNNFRPILPAPTSPDVVTRTPSAQSTPSEPAKRKRSSTSVACNGCRSRKSACDGKRPSCKGCLARGMDCVYISATADETPAMAMKREIETLRDDCGKLKELIDALRAMPEPKAIDTLRRLRLTTTDPLTLMRSSKEDFLDKALPRLSLARPASQGSVEFELMVRHAVAYPTLVPLDSGAIGMPTLLAGSQASGVASEQLSTPSRRQPATTNSLPLPIITQNQQPSTLIYGAYCDSRLEQLNITYWSKVQITNELAATLLSIYLETDHPTLGLFDADLFLTDLVGCHVRYCSPFLVSAVLSWACHAYCTVDSETASIGRALLEEANHLWQSEQTADSLPTVSASQILSLSSVFNGNGDGLHFLNSGIQMAQRMGLFGLAGINTLNNENEDMPNHFARARAHTAWGVFNWVTMRSLMYQKEELAARYPPTCRPPGLKDHARNSSAAGPEPAHTTQEHKTRGFPAMCEFWLLTSKWTTVYYATHDVPTSSRVPFQFARKCFQKLLNWSDRLATMMARGDQNCHQNTILHIWFHASIVELFRPFAYPRVMSQQPVAASEVDFAADVVTASTRQLKHLVVVFRYTYPCASYAVFWHVALLHVANAVLRDTSDPEWHRYLTLSLDGYADLFRAFPVAIAIVKSLLNVGMRLSVMEMAEAQEWINRVRNKGRHHTRLDNISASFVVDLNLAATDEKAAQLATLGSNFDDVSLFHELLDLEPDNNSS